VGSVKRLGNGLPTGEHLLVERVHLGEGSFLNSIGRAFVGSLKLVENLDHNQEKRVRFCAQVPQRLVFSLGVLFRFARFGVDSHISSSRAFLPFRTMAERGGESISAPVGAA